MPTLEEANIASPTLPLRERDRRWAALRDLLRKLDLDAVLVFGLKSRDRYDAWLANELSEGVVLFPLEGDPTLVTWVPKIVTRRFAPGVDPGTFWISDVRIGLYSDEVVAWLEAHHLETGRVGVVGLAAVEPALFEGYVPWTTWQKILGSVPNATFTDISRQFGRLMLRKSDDELVLLRKAASIGELAAKRARDLVHPGTSEREIYSAILDVIHSNGARTVEPHLIMTFGADDLGWDQPVWLYSGGPERRVAAGDLVNLEIFVAYGGLEAQLQLSLAVPPVAPLTMRVADVARRCYDAGIAALRPGVTFEAVCEAFLQPLVEAKCWNLTPMVHSLGPISWIGHIHVGIERFTELSHYPGAQRVIPPTRAPLVLEPGMVFAFEPNAADGRRRVNIGGTVVVGVDAPVELNEICNTLQVTRQ